MWTKDRDTAGGDINMKMFTRLDLHNPTKRQFERMRELQIPYMYGMSWVQAKYLIEQATKNKKRK